MSTRQDNADGNSPHAVEGSRLTQQVTYATNPQQHNPMITQPSNTVPLMPSTSHWGANQSFDPSQYGMFGASQYGMFGPSQSSTFGPSQPDMFGPSQPDMLILFSMACSILLGQTRSILLSPG